MDIHMKMVHVTLEPWAGASVPLSLCTILKDVKIKTAMLTTYVRGTALGALHHLTLRITSQGILISSHLWRGVHNILRQGD